MANPFDMWWQRTASRLLKTLSNHSAPRAKTHPKGQLQSIDSLLWVRRCLVSVFKDRRPRKGCRTPMELAQETGQFAIPRPLGGFFPPPNQSFPRTLILFQGPADRSTTLGSGSASQLGQHPYALGDLPTQVEIHRPLFAGIDLEYGQSCVVWRYRDIGQGGGLPLAVATEKTRRWRACLLWPVTTTAAGLLDLQNSLGGGRHSCA